MREAKAFPQPQVNRGRDSYNEHHAGGVAKRLLPLEAGIRFWSIRDLHG